MLIVRGTSHLLDTVEAQADIERVRTLFDDIERKNDLIRLLELAKDGDGVRIFIGSENRLFCCPAPRSWPRLMPMRRQDRGRDRRPGPHPAELRPHHSDGGPYRQSHWTIARLKRLRNATE